METVVPSTPRFTYPQTTPSSEYIPETTIEDCSGDIGVEMGGTGTVVKKGVVSLGDTQYVGGRVDNHHDVVVNQNTLPTLSTGNSSTLQLTPSSRSEEKLTRSDNNQNTRPSAVIMSSSMMNEECVFKRGGMCVTHGVKGVKDVTLWEEWGLKNNVMYGYLLKQKNTYRCGGKPVIAGHLSPTEVLKNEVVVQRTTRGRNIESGRNLSKD